MHASLCVAHTLLLVANKIIDLFHISSVLAFASSMLIRCTVTHFSFVSGEPTLFAARMTAGNVAGSNEGQLARNLFSNVRVDTTGPGKNRQQKLRRCMGNGYGKG